MKCFEDSDGTGNIAWMACPTFLSRGWWVSFFTDLQLHPLSTFVDGIRDPITIKLSVTTTLFVHA